jgi:hypothetical protein
MTRDDIQTYARQTYLPGPTPWRHMGRTVRGVDCIGMICGIADHFDIPYEDISGYSRSPDGRFVDHVMKHMVYRNPQVIAPGCAVILRDSHQPCHIGLITFKNDAFYLLHASLQQRKVVEEEWTSDWVARFRCALDFPGVED